MMKVIKVLFSICFWVCFIPIMLIFCFCKEVCNDKPKRRRGGVMCGPGGVGARGGRKR